MHFLLAKYRDTICNLVSWKHMCGWIFRAKAHMLPFIRDSASKQFRRNFVLSDVPFFPYSLMNKVVALKEIRLEAEEGTPFTAIREGNYRVGEKEIIS